MRTALFLILSCAATLPALGVDKGEHGEKDGWLVGVAQDTTAGMSVLTVFDAARIAAGPVAMARLGYRVPHCFHGNFLQV